MGRVLKPLKVGDVWCDSTRTRVEIMLDRNHNTFFAKVGEQTVTAVSADECKRLALEMAAKVSAFVWTPWIEVKGFRDEVRRVRHYLGNHETVVGIDFSFSRLELSPDPYKEGRRVQRPHTDDFLAGDPGDHDRERRKLYKDVTTYSRHDHVLLPYTEESWNALQAITDALTDIGEKLRTMFADDEVEMRLRRIATAGVRLLGM